MVLICILIIKIALDTLFRENVTIQIIHININSSQKPVTLQAVFYSPTGNKPCPSEHLNNILGWKRHAAHLGLRAWWRGRDGMMVDDTLQSYKEWLMREWENLTALQNAVFLCSGQGVQCLGRTNEVLFHLYRCRMYVHNQDCKLICTVRICSILIYFGFSNLGLSIV